MAKKSGTSSWLTAVKRAFRSPTKDYNVAERKISCRRRDDENNQYHEQEDEDQKVISTSI